MAYKDEYEVARLYTDGTFEQRCKPFQGRHRLTFHLAPPLLATPRSGFTGEPRKMKFGPWMMTAFRLLARFKGLRGTAFDVFGYSAERRQERALIDAYRDTIAALLPSLAAANHALAVEIASIPEQIRGYRPCQGRATSAVPSRGRRNCLRASARNGWRGPSSGGGVISAACEPADDVADDARRGKGCGAVAVLGGHEFDHGRSRRCAPWPPRRR